MRLPSARLSLCHGLLLVPSNQGAFSELPCGDPSTGARWGRRGEKTQTQAGGSPCCPPAELQAQWMGCLATAPAPVRKGPCQSKGRKRAEDPKPLRVPGKAGQVALRNAELCAGLQMPPKLWPPFWKSFEREILPADVPPVIDRDRSFFAKPSKLLFPNGLLPGAKVDQWTSCLWGLSEK